MFIIGLTGGIATGKSVVANFFRKMGLEVIDADQIAREVVEPHSPTWQAIVDYFGPEYLNPDQTINRKLLGDRIFQNPQERLKLNHITHPPIVQRTREKIQQLEDRGKRCVVIEGALLGEKNTGLNIDCLVVVVMGEERRLKLLTERDSISRAEALARVASQLPQAEKAKKATFVIDNSGTLEETQRQVEGVWLKIQEKMQGGRKPF